MFVKNIVNIMHCPNRKRDGQIEMRLVAKLFVTVVYVKVTERSLTTSGTTAQVVSKTCQLVLLVVQQIGAGNLNGVN